MIPSLVIKFSLVIPSLQSPSGVQVRKPLFDSELLLRVKYHRLEDNKGPAHVTPRLFTVESSLFINSNIKRLFYSNEIIKEGSI